MSERVKEIEQRATAAQRYCDIMRTGDCRECYMLAGEVNDVRYLLATLSAANARADALAAVLVECRAMIGDGFNGDGDEYPRSCDTCNGSPKNDWRYKEYEKRHAERPDLVDLSSWGHAPGCARAALLARLDAILLPRWGGNT